MNKNKRSALARRLTGRFPCAPHRARYFVFAAALLSAVLVPAGVKSQSIFRTEVKVVEVYCSVTDKSGRHLSGLSREDFEILDNDTPQPIETFQATDSNLSCAVLLDATGSMSESMPAVKNAVFRLIDNLREGDAVAIYSFNSSLFRLQEFTSDKRAAKRAVLSVRTGGTTALFDALAGVNADLTSWRGKKSIVLFTDGADNASILSAGAAMSRIKATGNPVYSVAEGDALASPALMAELKQISLSTGASSYSARSARDIDAIFAKISQDLRNTYMLSYVAPPSSGAEWRKIQVAVKDRKDVQVRAREGYYAK